MASSNIVYLDRYRGKKNRRLQKALALHSHDPLRSQVLEQLSRALALVGGDRAALVWLEEYGCDLARAHAVLDLAADRPRRMFSPAPLRIAWETGVPGLVDLPDLEGSSRPPWDAVRSLCAVALGSDGCRSWFLQVDSLTPRPPLDRHVAGDLMFVAGECAAILLHRDLDSGGIRDWQGTETTPEGLPTFAGWTVLRDIEGREDDQVANERISVRFLVFRLLRQLVEDGLVVEPDSLGYQIRGIRAEVAGTQRGGVERSLWEKVLAAAELLAGDALLEATLELGSHVEEQGHLHGAREIHGLAFELAAALGNQEPAVDAARFQARISRKMADWDGALHWYGVARTLAEEAGDLGNLARVLDGLANTHRDRGSFPLARKLLQEVLALGARTGDAYARAIGHHDLMALEKLAGNLDEAILQGWEAVHAYQEEEGTLRALFDLAGVLRERGELPAAEDAYRVVAARVRGAEYRLLSLDALAYLAALRGDAGGYEDLLARVDALGWERTPAVVRSQILYFRGMALLALGRLQEGRDWLQRALAFAETHRLSKLIFDAEAALAASPHELARAITPPLPGAEALRGVRDGLRKMSNALVGAGAADPAPESP